MGTSNGLDDYSTEAICEYAENYGYIHEFDVESLKTALEWHGYKVSKKWSFRLAGICIFHKWKTTFKNGPEEVQKCENCGKVRSSTYDMMGGIGWESGDTWSKNNSESAK
jgi:hypothetical protein